MHSVDLQSDHESDGQLIYNNALPNVVHISSNRKFTSVLQGTVSLSSGEGVICYGLT